MARHARRQGRRLVTLGLLLAAASLAVLMVIEPAAGGEARVVRVGAVSAFVGGLLLTTSGWLGGVPASKSSLWRSQWYGVLLLVVGAVNLLAAVFSAPEPSWLSWVFGIAGTAAGLVAVTAARRRQRSTSA